MFTPGRAAAQQAARKAQPNVDIPREFHFNYSTLFSVETINALNALAHLDEKQRMLMQKRMDTRKDRIKNKEAINFLPANTNIPGTNIKVADARNGNFVGSAIPHDLKRQWVQGTGPAAKPNAKSVEDSLRNIAYALLSGADGWMFDGEDACAQTGTIALDNLRNIKLAILNDDRFMKVAHEVAAEMNAWSRKTLGKDIVTDVNEQLKFTTRIFRARGLHLDDRHLRKNDGTAFSASITDVVLYVTNNYRYLQAQDRSIVLYLPKIQTAEEAAFWHEILSTLEQHLGLEHGVIKTYVLAEQIEEAYQLAEIRAALGQRFVGFNTGRWDYINSVADANTWNQGMIHPNITDVGMTYGYMAEYEKRVWQAVNVKDKNGNCALWQGGMEPNIPVGSPEGVKAGMKKALAGAERERKAGASGKWVAHWKMVHPVREVWAKIGQDNQLGMEVPALEYTDEAAKRLLAMPKANRTLTGARDLISVALQYGNAFLQGHAAAALKRADCFNDDSILYLMEDAATGEIRVSILWEWLHKGAMVLDEATGKEVLFTRELFEKMVGEEYQKLLNAKDKDVHDSSKQTTLPIAKLIVSTLVKSDVKAPWYIDLLNLNLNNEDLTVAEGRVAQYMKTLATSNVRMTANSDHDETKQANRAKL